MQGGLQSRLVEQRYREVIGVCFELRRKLPFALAALFLCASLCFSQATDNARQLASHQPVLNQIMSWLPADTETVFSANGPFALPNLDALPEANSQSELRSGELELRTRSLPLFLFNFKNGGLQDFLKDKIVTLAVEGSRRFRAPAALG